jgi:hypothetical protein
MRPLFLYLKYGRKIPFPQGLRRAMRRFTGAPQEPQWSAGISAVCLPVIGRLPPVCAFTHTAKQGMAKSGFFLKNDLTI